MISAWRTLPFEVALVLIEAVLFLNATSNLALAYPLKQKRQPFLPPTAPFHVITNSSTFKLTIRHDSEWLTGWTFVNKVKLLKTIFVGRVQHMKILLLTKILIFRYQNVLWITTEYNWVFYSRLKPVSEPTRLEILKPLWDVQKKPNWHFGKKTQVLFDGKCKLLCKTLDIKSDQICRRRHAMFSSDSIINTSCCLRYS